MYKILIVEDDRIIADNVCEQLLKWGYDVKIADDFNDVLKIFAKYEPQLVLMDIGLPYFNGYHWCMQIRNISKVPVIFMSSMSDNMNIVMAINMGGDDFIVKPFDINVLIAKVQAMLRRTYSFAESTNIIEHNGCILNINDQTFTYNGKRMELTKNEYRILQSLLENIGKVVSRDNIMMKLWESDDFIDDNTLTVQNTTGVTDIMEVSPKFLAEQLDGIFTDIYSDAVKTGMVASGELIQVIADKLTEYKAGNIVVDPVMVATSGARLISEDVISILKSRLLPLATVITPNIPEAEVLSGVDIKAAEDMEKAAELICDTLGCSVLLKGGHQLNDANDLLFQKGKEPVWFYGKRINNPNTHGTGCTLSSAIASNLAKGRDLETSVRCAKNYISGALAAMLDLGKGSGPMNHAFAIDGEYHDLR